MIFLSTWSYRPNKGTKLANFAARCIENEILMHLRSLKKTRKDVFLHDPIGTDKEGNEITLIDILGSEADDVIKEVEAGIPRSYNTVWTFLVLVDRVLLRFSLNPNRGIWIQSPCLIKRQIRSNLSW